MDVDCICLQHLSVWCMSNCICLVVCLHVCVCVFVNYLFVCSPLRLSVSLSVYASFFYSYDLTECLCLFVYTSLPIPPLSDCLFVCLYLSVSLCLSVFLYMSVCSSVTYLSVCLWLPMYISLSIRPISDCLFVFLGLLIPLRACLSFCFVNYPSASSSDCVPSSLCVSISLYVCGVFLFANPCFCGNVHKINDRSGSMQDESAC